VQDGGHPVGRVVAEVGGDFRVAAADGAVDIGEPVGRIVAEQDLGPGR